MALWRLSDAAYPSSGSEDRESSGAKGRRTAKRLAASGKAVTYAVIAYSVLKFALGKGTQSSDKQSVDLTATVTKYPAARSSWS